MVTDTSKSLRFQKTQMFSQMIDQKEHKNNRYKLEPATWCYKHHSTLLLLDWLLLCCRCFHCDQDARALPAAQDFCFPQQQTPEQSAAQIESSESEVNTAVSRTFWCFATSGLEVCNLLTCAVCFCPTVLCRLQTRGGQH